MSTVNEKMVPTPHIDAKVGEIAETILLPGDPLRARFIAEKYMTDVKQFNHTRGILGYTGRYNGTRLSIMGTGMGVPSMGIYSHELINFYGCRNLIRIGTAGALHPDVKVRDLVFAMGASTDSAYLKQVRPNDVFAPLADFDLLTDAVEIAKKKGSSFHVGNVFTTDTFYTPNTLASGVPWRDLGVLCVEMETAALYCNAAYGGARALSVLTVSDSLVTGEALSAAEREQTFVEMCEIALDTAVNISAEG